MNIIGFPSNKYFIMVTVNKNKMSYTFQPIWQFLGSFL